MSEYSTSTSYDPSGRPTGAPRQALAYVAGATALVFLAGCAILGLLYYSANRTAEEAVDARTVAENKAREAESREQKSLLLVGTTTSERERADTQARGADQAREKAQQER